ncbi:cytosolic phospholipase A2 beta-like [Eucyclogobius newberryi]|uniref:cytosolic phospholipase A2 beta-like n=1 Tax=Eucyclogobius newberryi TaxID=166745 RepID=UPI003B5A041B
MDESAPESLVSVFSSEDVTEGLRRSSKSFHRPTTSSVEPVSGSDFYVTLTLPTATATTERTKTINNNNCPEWNENFNFRVPVQTKNILEIRLYDEDLLSRDDLVSTVLLDLSTLELDTKLSKSFIIGPETEDLLELDFQLQKSEEKAQKYQTNGILMAPPLAVINVKVKNLSETNSFLSRAPRLKLGGAYERSVSLTDEEVLQFHVNRELKTEVMLTGSEAQSTIKTQVDLRLDRSKEKLRVRLSLDVPAQEKEFLLKRRKGVARALQALLGLDSAPSDKQVPTIALVASGGGARACTGSLGFLKGLKEIGVLDTATYVTGVSGSTWAMSTLCQDENWSQNLETIISKNKTQMTKSSLSAFSLEKMMYYHHEMEEKEKQGHLVSYIDMVGLVFEHYVFGQKHNSTLSDQQKTVKNGQNPLPIYTAVNVKEAINGHEAEAEWVEFTPFEVGLQKYGAFIRAEDFGSEFFLGHLIKKLPEMRLPFLMGIWSSAISVTLGDISSYLTGGDPEKPDHGADVDKIEEDDAPSTLDTLQVSPVSGLGDKSRGFFQNRPIANKTFNFTRGLSLHQDYGQNSNFQAQKESHPDAFPNQLTPSDPTLQLIDSGLAINIGCPPVLRPERHVDVIIVVSCSWDPQNIFSVLEKTSQFCEEHRVSFPSAEYGHLHTQPQREVYVFEAPEEPTAPIVLLLPLVNASYREYKAPGVRRETQQEVAAGQVDVSSSDSPFTTDHMTYSEADYDALIDLTSYNVLQSRDTILSALSRAMSRGRK